MKCFLHININGKYCVFPETEDHKCNFISLQPFPSKLADAIRSEFYAVVRNGSDYYNSGWYLPAKEEHLETLFDVLTAGLKRVGYKHD